MSESDILALIRGYATIPYRIYIEGNDTPLDEYEIISTTYEDYRYVDTDSLVIGQFVARTFNGEIKNINRDLLIENKEIEVRMGVKVGDTTTWYSLGNFLITKPEEDDVKDKMTFKSMDYTKKFNQKFDPTLVTFPCTALELATAVCNQCGVELATTDFTNSNFIIENNQYVNNESCRKVMQDIGKTAYSWVRIGWDNKCYIDFEVKTEVEDHNIITNDEYYDFSKQQKQFGVVNRVVVGMKDVDGENVAVQDDDSIAENGLCELHIYDNNLTYTPELRQQVIEGAKRLFGLKYVPVEVNTVGHPWLIGNELVRIIDMDGNAIDTYPFDRTIEYMGHIKTKLVSKAETQTQHEYVNNNTLGDLLNRTKIVVDKQNKTIQAIAEQSDSTSKKVAEFGITLDEISSSVSDTEEVVKDLESSIDYFSVDLAQYTLTIPTNSSKKPLETKNYDVPFYGYYKGKQVIPSSVTINGNNAGITTSKTNTYIRFAVDVNTTITNLSNDYTITFTYNSPDGVYTLVKKFTISLSIQGKDGKNGIDGKDGTSVNILGSYNSLEELKQAHPTGNVGDAYLINGDMYVWSVEENNWVDVGNIQGAEGKSAYEVWLDAGYTGTEQDYLNSLKGATGDAGYTPIKGIDYFDGQNGKDGYTPQKGVDYFDGTNGTDGRGIKTTDISYQIGTSGNIAPTGNWLPNIPTASAGQFIWTRTIITYTDNTSTTSYSVSKYGTNGEDGYTPVKGVDYYDGKDGENGKDGTSVSITSTSVTYQASSSGTVTPTGTWQTTVPSISNGQYLWTRTIVNYSDGKSTTSYSVSYKGTNGKDGYTPQKGIDYFDGKDGENGTSERLFIKYSANSNGNPMTSTPQSDTAYMGTAITTATTPPTSYTAYTWVKTQGIQGIAGKTGDNGLTPYVHIMYSADGSTFVPEEVDDNGNVVYPLGKKPSAWMGQYVDYNKTDSTDFNDYEWYKFTEDIDSKLEDMQDSINDNATNINNNYQDLVGQIDKKANDDELITVKNSVETITTKLESQIAVTEEIIANGVSKVTTATGTFDINGLLFEKSGAETSTRVNQIGVNTKDSNQEDALFAGYVDENKAEENEKLKDYKGQTVVYSNNMIVENYLVIGTHSRIEDYEDGSGIFVTN